MVCDRAGSCSSFLICAPRGPGFALKYIEIIRYCFSSMSTSIAMHLPFRITWTESTLGATLLHELRIATATRDTAR
eukprot:scaffold180129_cov31-Tisochrysis_lutea.AAC.1